MELLEWVEINETQTKRKLTDYKYFELCFVGGICLLTLIFGLVYVLMSKTVYFWDDATYWDIARKLASKQFGIDFLKEVYTSIGTSDYNSFIAVPTALWMKIFGVTRVSYICSVILFYLIPSQIVMYLLAKKLSQKPLGAFCVTVVALPALCYITFIGFIDVAGVLAGLLCYYFYMTDVLKNKPYMKSVIIGVLLVLMMITRRYFAFFSVSFMTLMIIDTVLFKHNVKELATVLVSFAAVLLVLFYPFFKNILLKDYGTLYSSYKYSVGTDIKLITRYFGTVFLLTVFVLAIRGAIKNKELKSIFALLQAVVCAAMFMSTQTHGQQHLFLYIPALAVLAICIFEYADKKVLLWLICGVSVLNLISPCINREQPQNIQEIKRAAMFPNYSNKPKKRDDVNALLALKRTLDVKIPEGKTCGVLASSFVINSSILTNIVPSLNKRETRADGYIIGLPEVDSRDMWRLEEIYNCDYLLVATPAQTHLAPEEQTIICEAVKSFENSTDIAKSFSKMSDVVMEIKGIDINLYKRISPVTETAKKEFQLRLGK